MRIKYVLSCGVKGAALGFFSSFIGTGLGIRKDCAPSNNADFSNPNVTAADVQCLDDKFESIGFGTSNLYVNSIFNIPTLIASITGFTLGIGYGIKREMQRDADPERQVLLALNQPPAPVRIVSSNPSSQFASNNPRNIAENAANRPADYNALQGIEIPMFGSVNP